MNLKLETIKIKSSFTPKLASKKMAITVKKGVRPTASLVGTKSLTRSLATSSKRSRQAT